MRKTVTCGALLSLAAQIALAQPGPSPAGEITASSEEDRAAGYCDFVRGVGSAEAALEVAPELFAAFGVVNAGEATAGAGTTPLGEPTPRVTAGVNYDVVGLYRGRAIRRRAEADCRRQRALIVLESAIRQGNGLGEETALEARARVLDDALPHAEAMLKALRDDLKLGQVTLEEMNAVQVRLDGLRQLATTTQVARERLAARPRFKAGERLEGVLNELRAADDQFEEYNGSLRRSRAWRLSLRGGYDRLIDVDQDVPLFGQLTLSYNLGHLWQGSANARAREGRRKATIDDVSGVPQRVNELIAELRVVQRTEEGRLREVSTLVSDLEAQLQSMEALQTREIRRFRGYVMLELTRLRAEQAYLRAHVESLQTFLGARAQ
ncbi:hypothetical protein A176_003443 [Myxococcus hansupus]|uniref:Heavy metal RND efflux outer membrane protein, CzcC family n=1 Tax=Pseudomyxococcus hansupus TaxID=1297742 RepID=A0A0H4WST5_9BACT|nr:hypothetical protein [Myxococcus hansupus]AKQ66531.1 hypothetical protein A176_003443 [Myxococcus hansupus]